MGEEDARVRSGLNGDVPVRDAATVILVRDPATAPAVLMGQRGTAAAFMADKFVFPGGAVDATDGGPVGLGPVCRARLGVRSERDPEALAAAALRELHEETGQVLDPAEPGLSFFFRAITPPGRPRRFDARFFLGDAASLAGDPDIFEPAEAELAHLQWVPLSDVRRLPLPFITRIVLAELQRHLPRTDAPERVAFVRNDDIERDVLWL